MNPDDKLLIEHWLAAPEEVYHDLHFIGPRLLSRNETVAVHYTYEGHPLYGGERIVVCSERLSMAARSLFPDSVRVFGLPNSDANKLFNFFDIEHNIKHGSRSENREPEIVMKALEILFEHKLPEPPRLKRAARADTLSGTMGHHAAFLLAFRDLLVPQRYRYAMPSKTLTLPNRLAGSTWAMNYFTVFDNVEDAVGAKMLTEQTIIIDLDGEDEVTPPPPPPSDPDPDPDPDDDGYPF